MRLRRAGHAYRMPDDRVPKKVLTGKLEGKKSANGLITVDIKPEAHTHFYLQKPNKPGNFKVCQNLSYLTNILQDFDLCLII